MRTYLFGQCLSPIDIEFRAHTYFPRACHKRCVGLHASSQILRFDFAGASFNVYKNERIYLAHTRAKKCVRRHVFHKMYVFDFAKCVSGFVGSRVSGLERSKVRGLQGSKIRGF